MRIGVVGCGYWGSKHVRVLSGMSNVEQVVIIDQRRERLETLQQVFPLVETAFDVDDVLPQLDALVIATPPRSHGSLAARALQAGCSVLVEKPLATSTVEAVKLIDLAERNGQTLMVGHTFEYNAAVWTLRNLIQSGTLGEVLYIDAARLNLGLYQSHVNVIWDLAPHDFSIINHILGAVPDEVAAWGSSHRHATLEDVAYVKLEYRTLGVTAHIHVSWLDPQKVRRVTVVGDQQMAVYNDLVDDERIRIYDKGVGWVTQGEEMHAPATTYRYGGIRSPYIDFREPLQVEDGHFIDCVLTGKRPDTDGRSGLAVVQGLEAAERSLRLARPVEIAELSSASAVA